MQKNSSSTGWILYESVSSQDHLQQGDLIEFQNNGALNKYGLVVTADCDLDKVKHGRLITLVPLVSVKTVAEYYLLLEQLDRQRANLGSYVKKKLCLQGEINDPIVVADLRSRVESLADDPDSIILHIATRSLLNDLDTISCIDFSRLMAAIGVSVSNLHSKITDQIKNKGDLVMVPTPEFLSAELAVAWVRPVWQVPVRDIVLQNSKIDKALGVRIARLDSPFRYRVTQVMGQVFSDIGTPDISHDFSTSLGEMFR